MEQVKNKGPNLLAKYRWLANQFNAAVAETFQGEDIGIRPIEIF
jgi:hypothetical protein